MARRRQTDILEETPKVKLNREKLLEAARIFRFIRPYRRQFILGMVLLVLSSLVFMVFPYLLGVIVDVAQGKGEYAITLEQIGLILLVFLIVQSVVSYFRVLLFVTVSERGIADVRRALYDKLVTLPLVFFEENRVGDLLSRLTNDVEKLYNAFSITLAEFLRQVIILIVGILFLLLRAPKLSLIMLAVFPVVVVSAMFFGRYIRRLSRERQRELAAANVILNETTQAIQVVKSFTNELFESLRFGRKMDQVVDVALQYARMRALFSSFIILFLFGAIFFIIWMAAYMVSSGSLTLGRLIEFVVLTGILGGAISGLGNFYTELLAAVGATERIREILDEGSEVALDQAQPAVDFSLTGAIRYEGVHFSYPTRKDVPVLRGIDLEAPAGRKIALVGASGAGKSTIVQLLLRFYDLDAGDIRVNGNSIYDLDLTTYRRNLAVVPQEVLLFGGTIRENILYGKPEATEEEVIAAARKANAWEFIQSFPEGLDTVVGERGVKLSGGQRQRVAIARAILKDPAILLLDEATSSLDAESERLVQEALNQLMEGRTSIIIAHRLATIRDVDRIYVIEHGRIVEQGTHEELSQLDNGVYNALAKLQFEPIS